MQLRAKENLVLIDAKQQSLGEVAVEGSEKGLVIGEFIPNPAFTAVERLFLNYEEAVNLQSLAVVDELDDEIARLGLHVLLPEGQRVEVRDVQIWSDGGIAFRPLGQDQSILEACAIARPTKR